MQGQLEFHDSEVHRIELQAGDCRIAFSAASVQAQGLGAGYVQSLELRCPGAWVDGPLADGLGRLVQGQVWVQGQALARLPFPYTAPGPVRLLLQFANGVRLDIRADGLLCQFSGEPGFVESFAC